MSTATTGTTSGPAKSNPCPKCGKPLTDTAGLGWCSACGYCRSLEEHKDVLPPKSAAPVKKASVGGLVELGEAIGGLPRWVWIMVLGVLAFWCFSLLPNHQLPPNSLERAIWTTCQIVVGLLVIYCAQLLAMIQIAHEDEKLTFRDTLLPARLWTMTCKRLPRTYLPVWLGSWGLSMVLSALIFIGGLPYWLYYLPGSKPPKPGQTTSKNR